MNDNETRDKIEFAPTAVEHAASPEDIQKSIAEKLKKIEDEKDKN